MNNKTQKKKAVLIAGGTGLIGKALAQKLSELNYEVHLLTRNLKQTAQSALHYWNPEKNEFNADELPNFDYLINLSGENISNKRWSAKQKSKIVSSRTQSTNLLFKSVLNKKHIPKAYISAGAIGYYGTFTSQDILTETSHKGSDFLAKTCAQWEESAFQFERAGVRTVVLRTGVVLSTKGGALPKLLQSKKFGLLPILGNGKQYVPWIHINDLVDLFIFALENSDTKAIYNAVAPEAITHKTMMQRIKDFTNTYTLQPHIPAFIIRSVFGEMSSILLKGAPVSSKKIRAAGFRFQYPDIESAFDNLLNKH